MVKINEFEEHMKLQQPLLVKDVKNGTTSKGSPYLSLTLQDKTGTIDGKFWDVKENEQALIQAGKILKFSFEVLLYKDKLQLRMNHVEEISEDEYNLEDFVISSDHSSAHFLISVPSSKEEKSIQHILKPANFAVFASGL